MLRGLQVGPHWPVTLFTYSLIIVPSILFLIDVAVPLHAGVAAVGCITFISVLLCFSMVSVMSVLCFKNCDPFFIVQTACSDPGIVYSPVIKGVPDLETNSPSDANGLMECNKCNVRRPMTATHCYDCDVCIDKVCEVSSIYNTFLSIIIYVVGTIHNTWAAVGSPLPLGMSYNNFFQKSFYFICYVILCRQGSVSDAKT